MGFVQDMIVTQSKKKTLVKLQPINIHSHLGKIQIIS